MNSRERYIVVGSDLDLFDDIERAGSVVVGYFSLRDKGFDYEYLGSHEKINTMQRKTNSKILIAVDDTNLRQNLWKHHKEHVTSYFSPFSNISEKAQISLGCVIYPNVFIGPLSRVDINTKVSVGVQIHHECVIRGHSVICPRALILGRVTIGLGAFIGSASILGPAIEVGDQSVVGMGSVVTKNVPDKSLSFGSPAKVKRRL